MVGCGVGEDVVCESCSAEFVVEAVSGKCYGVGDARCSAEWSRGCEVSAGGLWCCDAEGEGARECGWVACYGAVGTW